MTYSENELPGGSVVKNPPAGAGDASSIPGLRRSPEKETAAHSSTLAWEIPGTEEPGRLQSMGHKSPDTTERLNNNTMLRMRDYITCDLSSVFLHVSSYHAHFFFFFLAVLDLCRCVRASLVAEHWP